MEVIYFSYNWCFIRINNCYPINIDFQTSNYFGYYLFGRFIVMNFGVNFDSFDLLMVSYNINFINITSFDHFSKNITTISSQVDSYYYFSNHFNIINQNNPIIVLINKYFLNIVPLIDNFLVINPKS